ncbi:hypothetical protein DSO57_1011356 [Entomophthora muscae]|uniref:Uncharacterized protein n=1 Tax=Entomophthora muscae TaxID=34485 RepID=A0ACC2U4R4_9FUNG|nr:hypothetical protein DSO57_1011356 [Entomophthora muscae]
MSRVTRHLPPGASPSPAKAAPANLPSYAQTAKQVRQASSKPDTPLENKVQANDQKTKTKASDSTTAFEYSKSVDSGRTISPQSDEARYGSSGVRFPLPAKPIGDKKINFFASMDSASEPLTQKTFTFTSLSFGDSVSVSQPSKDFSSPSLQFSVRYHHSLKTTAPIDTVTKTFPSKHAKADSHPAPPTVNGTPKSGAPPSNLVQHPPYSGTPPHQKQGYMPGGFAQPAHFGHYPNQQHWQKPMFQMPSPGQPANYRAPHPRGQDKPNAPASGPPPPGPSAGFQASSSPNPAMGMPGANWHPQPFYPNYQMPNFDPSFSYPNYIPPPHAFHANMPPPAGPLPHLNTNAVPFVPKPAVSKAIKIVNPNSGQEVDLSSVAAKKDTTPTVSTPVQVRLSKPASQPETSSPQEQSKPATEAPIVKPIKEDPPKPVASEQVPAPPKTDAASEPPKVNGALPPVEAKPENVQPIVEPPKEAVVEEPTIISTNTETVILKKTKPKRSVRAEVKATIAPEEPKEVVSESKPPAKAEVKAETVSNHEVATDSKPDSKPKAEEVQQKSPEAPTAEVPSAARTSAAPPGFAERKPFIPQEGESAAIKLNGISAADSEQHLLGRLVSSNPTTPRVGSPTINSPRTTEFFDQVNYPPNISRPVLPDGKFRYDRTFLLQFREMCVDKPSDMKHIDSITDEIRGDGRNRGGKQGSHRGMPGEFGRPKTSEDRFKLSNLQMRNDGRNPLTRSSSSGMLNMGKDMRNRGGRTGGRGSRHGSHNFGQNSPTPTIPLEDVEPLQASENRWVPNKDDSDKEAKTTRKVKALLNKLTLEKFEPISTQIIEIANESVNEEDGATLKLVIQIIFEKATDEPNFSAMYAQLCRKMQADLNPDISDPEARNKDGVPITGGFLFRKYLLTRCQSDFVKGWKTDDVQKHQGSVDLLSDEYYAAAKAKRQGLGLIRFIGELFKLGMLTERIMQGCIAGMLSKEFDEEEVESLFKLMTTIGKQIDVGANIKVVDSYFVRITELSRNENLPQRARFMLQDLIDLRKHRWESRRGAATGPKTLQEIKQDADREAEEKLKQQDKLRRTASSSGPRQSFQARNDREKSRTSDGWNTVNSPPPTRAKTGDLSGFGNLSRSKTNNASLSLGPSSGSVFNSLGSLKSSPRDGASTLPRKSATAISSNMFNMLAEGEPKSDSGRPALKLLPKSSSTEPSHDDGQEDNQEDAHEEGGLSDEAFSLKAENTLKELWALGDYSEAMLCLRELTEANRDDELVYKFMTMTMDKKAVDIIKVERLFERAAGEGVISMESFLAGAKKMAADLDDLSIDVPAAFDHMAALLNAFSITLSSLLELMEPLTQEPSRIPHGPKLFIAFAKLQIQAQKEESLIEELKDESCSLTKLYHKDNQTPEFLAKLINNSALAPLVPTITSTSWWKALHPDL